MQGWSPDFVSSLTEAAMAGGLVDQVIGVSGAEAMRSRAASSRVRKAFSSAPRRCYPGRGLAVAQRAPAGANIVCMLPDTGERYLSTPLFDGIEVDMNAAELEISRSTPRFRFDPAGVNAPPRPAPAAPAAEDDLAAERFVDRDRLPRSRW
jgi:cysteine synthase